MRSPLALPFLLALQVGLLAASLGGAFTPAALAAEGFLNGPDGIVGGLAQLGDLAPLAAIDRAASVGSGSAATPASRPGLGRQSLPARDRALSYRSNELFVHSKSAVPLLVADLEPRQASVARPMSGRSVGARPSAAWTRSVPGSTSLVPESASSAALHW
jgi:hypothetical protein